jgi:hypothetical protein
MNFKRILLLSLLAVLPCQATTVVVIVVPEGIVLAADGLTLRKTRDGSAIGTRASTKVFLDKRKALEESKVRRLMSSPGGQGIY